MLLTSRRDKWSVCSHDSEIAKTISTYCSDGVIAYHWIRFDVPSGEMEQLVKLTEERVLEVLRRGVRQEGKRSMQTFTITDITVSGS